MKKIFFTLFFAFVLLGGNFTFASDENKVAGEKDKPSVTIQLNGIENLSEELEDVDKEIEIKGEDVGGVLAVGVGLVIFFLIISLACFIFWIAMIVHAVSKPITSKAIWILILLLTGIIGAIVYYFAVKRDFEKKEEVITAEKVEENK